MKKIILTYILTIVSILLFGQINTNHFKFIDIEMSGYLDPFTNKLLDKGFIRVNSMSDYLSGKYINKKVKLLIITTKKTNTVWKVVIYFEKKNNWEQIKNEYYLVQSYLTKKYGDPNSEFNFFDSDIKNEMMDISKGNCVYSSFWKIDNGNIFIEINKNRCVVLSFEDLNGHNIMMNENL